MFILLNFGFGSRLPSPGFSGDFGINSEYDHNSDSSRQRSPAYAYNLSLNSSLNWWLFSAGLNLFYSSDDKFAAQKINCFNLNLTPVLKWTKIYLGDFSPTFSEYTLSGVSIYGAGIELSPKSWRFALVSGQSRRASTDSIDWSYKRNLYGLKLGSEYLSLVLLKARDDTSSLRPTDTIIPVPPQENLVIGLGSNFTIAQMISFDFEGAGSLHTRDLRSDTTQREDIPKLIYPIYQPRYSSRADFALRGGLKFNHKFASLDIGFAQIGPGFTSLGLSYIKNDSRKGRVGLSTRTIPKTNISLSLEKEYDNLVGDKLATTKTDNLNLSLSFFPMTRLNLAGNYSWRQMKKDAPNDSFKLNSLYHTIYLIPNLNFLFLGFNQNANIILTYQDYKNRVPFSKTLSDKALTVGLNYSITLKIPVTFSTAFNQTYNLSQVEEGNQESYHGYGLTANCPFLNDRLKNFLTISYQPSTIGDNFCLNGNSSYFLTQRDAFNLTWFLSFFSASKEGIRGFNSQRIGLNYIRKIF